MREAPDAPPEEEARDGPTADAPFHVALRFDVETAGDTAAKLSRLPNAVAATTIEFWMAGHYIPRRATSLAFLAQLEDRYGRSPGYLRDRIVKERSSWSPETLDLALPNEARSLGVPAAVIRWHIPRDFSRRSAKERASILAWISQTFVDPPTAYHARMREQWGSIFHYEFENLAAKSNGPAAFAYRETAENLRKRVRTGPKRLRPPEVLSRAWADFVEFKTKPILPIGLHRETVWRASSVGVARKQFGAFFGCLAASTGDGGDGCGLDPEQLTFALLTVPQVIDAFIEGRMRRRGFLAYPELAMVQAVRAMTAPKVGWLRQSPHLASQLRPIDGLLTQSDITAACTDWEAWCQRCWDYTRTRSEDAKRLVEQSREPLHAVLPVLHMPEPMRAYKRMADEVLRHAQDESRYPHGYAASNQFFLMIRLAMHTGFRSRALRQLLVPLPNREPRADRVLMKEGRAELQWSAAFSEWRITLPSTASKSCASSVFHGGFHRQRLPDVGGLYAQLQRYLEKDRPRLIGNRADPGTLFVHPVQSGKTEMTEGAFYAHWLRITQIYGVFNPWTGRGAVEGMRPHGPHAVRAIVATHVLKVTGSFEHASYAIQDVPETVARHYAAFMPFEASDLVSQITSKVWSDKPDRGETPQGQRHNNRQETVPPFSSRRRPGSRRRAVWD